VVVTIVGWLIFAKDALLLFLKPEALSGLFLGMHYGEGFHLFLTPAFFDRTLSNLCRLHDGESEV
jgi:hypothetical protein